MQSNPAGKLDLHILIEKEGDLYSTLCLELNVASQGETLEEARKNIREAIELFLLAFYIPHGSDNTMNLPHKNQSHFDCTASSLHRPLHLKDHPV